MSFQNCSKVAVDDMPPEMKIVAAGNADPDPAGNADPDPVADSGPTVTTTTTTVPPQAIYHPKISLDAIPAKVVEGQKSVLTIEYQDLDKVSYLCTDRVTKEILAAGSVAKSGTSVDIKVEKDIHCEAMGTPLDQSPQIKDSRDLTVDCGNRIKNTAQNKCEDFSCKQVKELTSLNDLLSIPARNGDGLCYAIKLLSKIAASSSSLTTSVDKEVVARIHGYPNTNKLPTITRNPYNMGSVKTEFRLEGPRVVKLAGSLDPTAKILVDNFILMGVYPSSQDVSQSLASVYKVMGTADSSIAGPDGQDSHSIRFIDTLIPVQAYADRGASSVTAVDITRQAEPQVNQTIDIRALDCGNGRELSDIYLLFQ
jgi:hypothetical protein